MKMSTMRMKVWSLTAACFFASLTVDAQINMRYVLSQMPDTLAQYLSKNDRLDLADFVDSGMKAEVANTLEGKTVLNVLSADYAKLTLNDAATIEMRLLPLTLDQDTGSNAVDTTYQTLCVVRTYGNNLRESVINFYTPLWTPLPVSNKIEIGEEWGTVDDDFGSYHVELGQHEPTLTLETNTQLDVPANEEQKKAEKKSIVLKWDGRRFKKY